MTLKTPTDAVNTKEYKYLLRLLSSVLSGKDAPRPNDDINWAAVFSAASKHSVAGMAFYAVKTLPNDSKPLETVYADFLNAYRAELVLEGNIKFETDRILADLTEAEIDVLPVKGIVLKDYYPVPSMRTMSDVDILYREQDKDKVISVFESDGYKLKSDGFSQLVFTKEPVYYYELHSALISEDKKDYEYFRNFWDKAVYTDKPHIASLTPEDSYIYLLEHLAKHIEGGGAGLRMVMDLFVYGKAHSVDFDEEYINSQLLKLNLCKFREKIEEIAKSWFDSDNPDTDSVCAKFILSCPTFGVVSNAIVFNSLMYERKKGKKQCGISRLFHRVFPSVHYINRRFPITKKCGFLYPVFVPAYWFVRLFKDKNVNYSSVKLYLNPDNANKSDDISMIIEEFGFDKRI